MYYFEDKVKKNAVTGQKDIVNLLGLSNLCSFFDRIVQGDEGSSSSKALQDIVFGPDLSRLVIKKLDGELMKNSLVLKSGPIPGLDPNIILGDKGQKRKDEGSNVISIKKIRQEDSQHRIIEH